MYKYIHTNTTNGFLLISGSPYGLSCLSCIQIHIKHRRLYGHPTLRFFRSLSLFLSLFPTHDLSLCFSQRLVNLIWHDCQSKCFSNFPTVWLSLSLSVYLCLSLHNSSYLFPSIYSTLSMCVSIRSGAALCLYYYVYYLLLYLLLLNIV